jgi:predicted nucleic acid-binding protein
MGQEYLIDTNILIYEFQDSFPSECVEFIDKIFDESFNISIISEIEFLGWNGFSKKDLQDADDFLDFACVYPLNSEIKNLAIKIKQKYNTKLGDAIIAATSIHHNCILVTRNSKDFEKIENLKLYNPFNES